MNRSGGKDGSLDSGAERTIRVFVSSTFKDMKAERNELVLRVFPKLRRLCESRAVTWSEIDLRWGITDEEAAEGRVLPICLEEIRRCRPYFIGLLGDRYGSINTDYREDLLQREPWLREHIGQGKSITELEILHGVLNDPQPHNRAFFYFRRPSHADRLAPEIDRSDFVSADAEERRKLNALKQRIRAAADTGSCSLRPDTFLDARQLGEWILEDFEALVDSLYPEPETPDPLTQMRMAHTAVAYSKAQGYVKREGYFERLDDFVAGGADEPTPLVVLGGSGMGKTALLAKWFLRRRSAHPAAFVLPHFIGAASDSADHVELLRRIMLELKNHFALPEDVPTGPSQVVAAFPEWLERAGERGEVVLILDALNQIEDHRNARRLGWLPLTLPPQVRLIISMLPGPCLDAATSRGWLESTEPLTVQPMAVRERRKFAERVLKTSGRKLSPARLDRLVEADQTTSPLFMRAMLDELRVMGEHELLDEQITDYLTAPDPSALFVKIIARWREVYSESEDLVARSLRLIWAARHGLSESELLGLLGENDRPLPRGLIAPFLHAAEGALIVRSGLMTLGHEFLRSAVEESLCEDAEVVDGTRHEIARFFGRGLHTPDRVVAERPWQLARAGRVAELRAFLLSPLMLRTIRSPRAFDEARRYWLSLDSSETVGEEIRATFERMVRDRPEPAAEGDIASALGLLLSELGYANEALWFTQRAETYYRRNMSAADERLLYTKVNRASVLILSGRLDEGGAILEEVLNTASERGVRDTDPVLAAASNYAHVLHTTGEIEAAYELYRDTSRRTARVYGKQHGDYVKRRVNELCLAIEVGDPSIGASDLRDSIDAARTALGPDHEATLAALHNLGSYYEKNGQLARAAESFEELLAESEAREGPEALPTLNMMISLARVRYKVDDVVEGSRLFSTCFARASDRHGPLAPIALTCLGSWVALSIGTDLEEPLDEPLKKVLRAFIAQAKDSRTKHSQHDEFSRMFLLYMMGKKGVPGEEAVAEYKRLLTNS